MDDDDNSINFDKSLDTPTRYLCSLVRKGSHKPGVLEQVGDFEDLRMPPGLLIDGECKTCNNNRNKCFHTVVYKKGQITSFLSHTTSDGPPALMFNLEPYMHAYTHTHTDYHSSFTHLSFSHTHELEHFLHNLQFWDVLLSCFIQPRCYLISLHATENGCCNEDPPEDSDIRHCSMYMTREEFEKVLARNVNSDGTGPKLHCISRNRIPFFPNDLSEEYKSHVHARSQLCWNLDSMKDLCAPEERHVLTSETSFLLHCSGIISHVKVIIPRHLREFTCESELFGAVGAGDVGPEDVVDEASGAVVGDTNFTSAYSKHNISCSSIILHRNRLQFPSLSTKAVIFVRQQYQHSYQDVSCGTNVCIAGRRR